MLKRRQPNPDYKETEDYTWPIMVRKMDQYQKQQMRATESHRIVILDIGNGTKEKKAHKGNGR